MGYVGLVVQTNPCGKFYTSCLANPRVLDKRRKFSSTHYSYKHYHSCNFKIQQLHASSTAVASSFFANSEEIHLPLEVGTEKDGSSTNIGFEDLVWPSPSDEIPFWKNDFSTWKVSSEYPLNMEKDSDLMHIVHVTAEMAPIAKVGGLGDVVTGLARACLSRGHKVDIMLPFYECIQKQQINELTLITTYTSYHDGNWVPTTAYRGVVSDIPVIFIEPSNQFFKGQYVYGGSYNELEAYLFFSRACLEWLQVTRTQPDIIHVHEWQTGALPLLYWDMYHYLSLKKPRIVLTIHNMEHYGECKTVSEAL